MSKKILIIDDNLEVLDVMSGYFETYPEFEIETTSKPGLVIDKLKTEKFDLIITDMVMPETSGIELISEIRKFSQDQKILAFSGGGEAGSEVVAGLALDQALSEGASNAITKPFTEEELIEKVRLILRSA